MQHSVPLVPPRRVGIAHDLADGLVEQQWLDGAKEWKDQLEAHSGYLTVMEARRQPSFRLRERSGLCGRFLLGSIVGILLFRAGLLGAIQLKNRVHPNLPDGLLAAGLFAVIFPAAQLAFDLNVSALLERAGELAELAENDATVPFGMRDVLAVLLVRALGGERQRGEAAVVVGANLCVVAEEADEGDFVLVHDGDLRFVEFPVSCSGHTRRSLASGPGSQVPKVCFLGGARRSLRGVLCRLFANLFREEPRPRRGAEREAEDR